MPTVQKKSYSSPDFPLIANRVKKQSHTGYANIYAEPVRYLPAVLHKNDAMGWLIEYYVLNPVTNDLERKRLRMNKLYKRYKSQSEFRVAANNVVATINMRLAGGWTPFGESENSRYYTSVKDVMASYLKEKGKELRKTTLVSYESFGRMLLAWIEKTVPDCKCIFFNRTLAVRYMDDYYERHTNNGSSYNNQLKMARAFFSWAKEKCYIKENPFEHIKAKKKPQKKRILVPADIRAQIREFFEKRCPEMVMICEMVYTAFIRPIEITRITVGMLHLDEHYIAMPGDITKNEHERNAPLSEELCGRLRDYVQGAPKNYFLFGEGWRPSKVVMSPKRYSKWWAKMREALKLPEEMQLYSLRDTGMFDKLKSGIDPLTVMQAADHHDLAMTTRYANHVDPRMIDIIRTESPDF